jgi:citrate synthase
LIGSTWISSSEACERLRVRPQTLYAYVSRGLLHPRREDRRSWYDVHELDALAAAGRRRTRAGRLEVLIDTELTLLDPAGRLAYRGLPVEEIVGRWSFERTARWLWLGVDDGEPQRWPAPAEVAAFGDHPARRVRSACAILAAEAGDEARALEAVPELGPVLIASLVAAVPPLDRDDGLVDADLAIAARLWRRLSPLAPTAARVRALDAAMVLLADHELAVSTVAARVAASAWAPPLDVVGAAMGAHAGWLHGGFSSTLAGQLEAGEPPTQGYGHPIYVDRDPRADLLRDIAAAASPRAAWSALAPVLDAGPEPANVDLVLAAFAVANRMARGAGEAIFAVSRTAGWLAHAAEEYRNPFRFRPRASYTGPLP